MTYHTIEPDGYGLLGMIIGAYEQRSLYEKNIERLTIKDPEKKVTIYAWPGNFKKSKIKKLEIYYEPQLDTNAVLTFFEGEKWEFAYMNNDMYWPNTSLTVKLQRKVIRGLHGYSDLEYWSYGFGQRDLLIECFDLIGIEHRKNDENFKTAKFKPDNVSFESLINAASHIEETLDDVKLKILSKTRGFYYSPTRVWTAFILDRDGPKLKDTDFDVMAATAAQIVGAPFTEIKWEVALPGSKESIVHKNLTELRKSIKHATTK